MLRVKSRKLALIRVMKKMNVDPKIIALFFNETIPPVLNYASVAFYDLLPKYLQEDLDKPRKVVQKLIGDDISLIINRKLNDEKLVNTAAKIRKDSNHPLYKEFQVMPSRSRLRSVAARTDHFKFSFVPTAV